MSKEVKHIAVIRLSAMGDVAMTVPVLRAFSQQYPHVKITFVSRPFFKPFFDDIPNLTFFPFEDKGKHKGLRGLIRLRKELKQLDVDAYADLHNVLRSRVVGFLLSIGRIKTATVDKARAEKKALTRGNNKVFSPLKPIITRHAEVFEELGFPVNMNDLKPVRPKTISPEVQLLAGVKSSFKWIGIAPFAQYSTKVYPEDLMRQVIVSLAENQQNKLFLFGSKSEVGTLEKLAAGFQNVIVVGGKLNLRQEIELISNLNIMLSMDSGNAHIAAMLDVAVITLWGATHPFAGFAPYNQPPENAITASRSRFPLLPTSVYGNKVVPGYEEAMRTIAPNAVVSRIEQILKTQ